MGARTTTKFYDPLARFENFEEEGFKLALKARV